MWGDVPPGWTPGRVRDCLVQDRNYVGQLNGTEYKRLSVSLYGRGASVSGADRAEDIRMTRHQFARAGQVIVSEIWAKKGAIAVVPPDGAGAIVTSHFYLFDAIADRCDVGWFEQLLRGEHFTGRINAISQGTTGYASVRPRDFLLLPVLVPPVPEQTAIAAVLGSVDEAISKTEAFIRQLERSKHAVMRELLTKGHSRHKAKLVSLPESWPIGRIASTIDKMPSHWKLVTLTKIAKLESGHTPSRKDPEYWNGDIPWLSLGDTSELKKLQVEKTSECVTQAGIDNSSARLLPADTVVLSRTAVRGLCSRLSKPMATSQDFVAFVCGPKVFSGYLMQLFRHMQREWRRLEQGSSPTNKTLYFSVFKGLKILLPPSDEQAAIAEVGEAFDVRIAAEARYLEQLRHTKRGLAQALLSGRVRVGAGKTNGARAASGVARRL